MGGSITIHPHEEHLLVIIEGEVTLADLKDDFRRAIQVMDSKGILKMLADIRKMSAPSMLTRYDFGKFIGDTSPRGLKIACLAIPELLTAGRFFQTTINLRGVNLKVITSATEAVSWLGISDTSANALGIE